MIQANVACREEVNRFAGAWVAIGAIRGADPVSERVVCKPYTW